MDIPNDYINIPRTMDFLLFEIQNLFPTKPGEKTRGMLTGAKSGNYFAIGLPFASIWVWPDPYAREQGYAITPLSPQCCFAALHDPKLKQLLAITETMRVAGSEARLWAKAELDKILTPKPI
ncbi:MAG: hypothetical protein H0V66_07135 [Bdellovibrionales bacterium]|nr:hypothetical protein [Bdellovibrionales bacterium]